MYGFLYVRLCMYVFVCVLKRLNKIRMASGLEELKSERLEKKVLMNWEKIRLLATYSN